MKIHLSMKVLVCYTVGSGPALVYHLEQDISVDMVDLEDIVGKTRPVVESIRIVVDVAMAVVEEPASSYHTCSALALVSLLHLEVYVGSFQAVVPLVRPLVRPSFVERYAVDCPVFSEPHKNMVRAFGNLAEPASVVVGSVLLGIAYPWLHFLMGQELSEEMYF